MSAKLGTVPLVNLALTSKMDENNSTSTSTQHNTTQHYGLARFSYKS